MEFVDAALKFQVAMSSFAAQRVLGVLPGSNTETVKAAQEKLYRTGEAAKKVFMTNTALFGAFQFADKAQSALASFASDTLSGKVLSPSYLKHVAESSVHLASDAVGALGSSHSRDLLKDQFGNTFDVIGFVNHVSAPKHLAEDGTYPLDEMVKQCYSHGDYPALWYVEGLGERYATAYLNDSLATGKELHGLLTTGKMLAADQKIQTMMHAGIGIIFAKHAVGQLTPWSTDGEIQAAVEVFTTLVNNNSLPGCIGAALESLGLVSRTWHGQLVARISAVLKATNQDLYEFFWHGCGRAMYFSPMYMMPGLSPWDAADSEPTEETARRNARAGVAWAFTIVNSRHPDIAANFLRHKAERIADNDAYTNGVYSTLTMATDMVPGHRFVRAFGTFQPEDAPGLASWNKQIGLGAGMKIDKIHADLSAANKLGEVFRYHEDLPSYAAAQAAQAAVPAAE
jgi:hypothetical protein